MRRCRQIGILAAGLALAAVAPGTARSEGDGAALFAEKCAVCHGTAGRTDEELRGVILGGWEMVIRHMQVRAQLPERDVQAMLRWMTPSEEESSAQWAAEAQRLYPDLPLVAERCTTCHGPDRIEDALAVGHDAAWGSAALGRMRTYGAKLNPREATSLQAALARRSAPAHLEEKP